MSVTTIPTCIICGSPLPNRVAKKFCTRACRSIWTKQRREQYSGTYLAIPTSTTGAMNELVAAIDLMRKGAQVFRALSPSCPCDLLVMWQDSIIKVEVRTAQIQANGEWAAMTSGKYDVLALVTRDGRIRYKPDPFSMTDDD